MLTIIWAALAVAALAALAGTLLFYVKPQRERLQKQIAELDAEREKLKTQTETRQKELLLEAREESLRLRSEWEQENKDKRAELQRLERKLAQKEEILDDKLSSLDGQREGSGRSGTRGPKAFARGMGRQRAAESRDSAHRGPEH